MEKLRIYTPEYCNKIATSYPELILLEINTCFGSDEPPNGNSVAIDPTVLHEILLPLLNEGPAVFVYKLKEGGFRRAVGTLNPALVPGKSYTDIQAMAVLLNEYLDCLTDPIQIELLSMAQKADKEDLIKKLLKGMGVLREEVKKEKKAATGIQSYYDLQRMAWRSYQLDSLVAVYTL